MESEIWNAKRFMKEIRLFFQLWTYNGHEWCLASHGLFVNPIELDAWVVVLVLLKNEMENSSLSAFEGLGEL